MRLACRSYAAATAPPGRSSAAHTRSTGTSYLQPDASRRNQMRSDAASGNQRRSMAIDGWRRQLMVSDGYQRQTRSQPHR